MGALSLCALLFRLVGGASVLPCFMLQRCFVAFCIACWRRDITTFAHARRHTYPFARTSADTNRQRVKIYVFFAWFCDVI